jgi:two-component SAPR family response regulator
LKLERERLNRAIAQRAAAVDMTGVETEKAVINCPAGVRLGSAALGSVSGNPEAARPKSAQGFLLLG